MVLGNTIGRYPVISDRQEIHNDRDNLRTNAGGRGSTSRRSLWTGNLVRQPKRYRRAGASTETDLHPRHASGRSVVLREASLGEWKWNSIDLKTQFIRLKKLLLNYM